MPPRAEYPRIFCPNADFPPAVLAAYGATGNVAIQLVACLTLLIILEIDKEFSFIFLSVIWFLYVLGVLSLRYRWGLMLLWYVVYLVISIFVFFAGAFVSFLLVICGMEDRVGISTGVLLGMAGVCLIAFILSLIVSKKTIRAIRRLKIVPTLMEGDDLVGATITPSTTLSSEARRRRNERRRRRENSEMRDSTHQDSPPIYVIAVAERGEVAPPDYTSLFPHGESSTSPQKDPPTRTGPVQSV